MADVIMAVIHKYQAVVIVLFIFATGGLMLLAFIKTRSAPAVVGVAALGIGAIFLLANMTTVADLIGEDVLGTDRVTVEQVTRTTVCTQQQSEVGAC